MIENEWIEKEKHAHTFTHNHAVIITRPRPSCKVLDFKVIMKYIPGVVTRGTDGKESWNTSKFNQHNYDCASVLPYFDGVF